MVVKKWEYRKLDKNSAVAAANECNLPFFLSMLLNIRGITGIDNISDYLSNETQFSDPMLIPGMEKAVERIQRAIDEFEKIAVYGDYDADGITATAILYSYLVSSGADVIYYIPDREKEGYGMNNEAVHSICDMGVKLIITVDNGITSIEETELAISLGADVIITDHHRPQADLPDAYVIVDPILSQDETPYRYLSGSGVAFKLVAALEGSENAQFVIENYCDLAAIGTVGDVVPLTGENRKIVKAGLKQIAKTDKPGLYALLEKSSALDKEITASVLAFTVVPRINAAGRVGSAMDAVKLLLSDDEDEASQMADTICDANVIRKSIENEIFEAACDMLKNDPLSRYDRVLVLSGENWHHGVIGIVASRITEKYGKPCIVISKGETVSKGSGRSIDGFSLFDAISYSADELIRFGGHTMAAGISIETNKIEAFRKKINEYAAKSPVPMQKLTIDCKLKPSALSLEMPKLIKMLEPFGTDNTSPVFALCSLKLKEIVPVGGGKHLRLSLQKDEATVQCIDFGCTEEEFPYKPGDILDLAVALSMQEYKGKEYLSIVVKDIEPVGCNAEELIGEATIFEKLKRSEELSYDEKALLLPDRDIFVKLYRLLQQHGGWNKDIISLYYESKIHNFGKLLTSIDVLCEKGLITVDNDYKIKICTVSGKTDLFDSKTIKTLS